VFDILDNNVYDTTPQVSLLNSLSESAGKVLMRLSQAYFVEFWDAIPHFQELHRKGVDWRKVRGRAWELIQKSMFGTLSSRLLKQLQTHPAIRYSPYRARLPSLSNLSPLHGCSSRGRRQSYIGTIL
jgi:hypothetical protein